MPLFLKKSEYYIFFYCTVDIILTSYSYIKIQAMFYVLQYKLRTRYT